MTPRACLPAVHWASPGGASVVRRRPRWLRDGVNQFVLVLVLRPGQVHSDRAAIRTHVHSQYLRGSGVIDWRRRRGRALGSGRRSVTAVSRRVRAGRTRGRLRGQTDVVNAQDSRCCGRASSCGIGGTRPMAGNKGGEGQGRETCSAGATVRKNPRACGWVPPDNGRLPCARTSVLQQGPRAACCTQRSCRHPTTRSAWGGEEGRWPVWSPRAGRQHGGHTVLDSRGARAPFAPSSHPTPLPANPTPRCHTMYPSTADGTSPGQGCTKGDQGPHTVFGPAGQREGTQGHRAPHRVRHNNRRGRHYTRTCANTHTHTIHKQHRR